MHVASTGEENKEVLEPGKAAWPHCNNQENMKQVWQAEVSAPGKLRQEYTEIQTSLGYQQYLKLSN